MMFKKFLNAATYNEERTKSRIRKARVGEEIVGFYTEIFLRQQDQKSVEHLSPRRMVLKDFASVRIDERLVRWQQRYRQDTDQ
ncbi:MAG: hypothetical protein AAGK47_06015 [Bacteroidota bacterium]